MRRRRSCCEWRWRGHIRPVHTSHFRHQQHQHQRENFTIEYTYQALTKSTKWLRWPGTVIV